jgi:hypothetical protein
MHSVIFYANFIALQKINEIIWISGGDLLKNTKNAILMLFESMLNFEFITNVIVIRFSKTFIYLNWIISSVFDCEYLLYFDLMKFLIAYFKRWQSFYEKLWRCGNITIILMKVGSNKDFRGWFSLYRKTQKIIKRETSVLKNVKI